MAAKLKSKRQPKAKSPQEVEELIELMRWKSSPKHCHCFRCQMDRALYECAADALLWSLGKAPRKYLKIIRAIKLSHAKQTKHHVAHAE